MHPLLAALYVATLQFAAGALLATLLSEWRAEVTAGFLRLAAVTALAGACLAYLLVRGAGEGEWACALGLLVGTLAYTLLQFGRARGLRLVAGGLGMAAGLAGLTLAAVARPSPLLGVGWTALASLASALALGTSTVALLLGHWYLVERRLPGVHMVRGAWWYAAGVVAAAGAAALSAGNPGPEAATGFSPVLAVPGFSVWLAGGLVAVCALIAGFVWRLAREGGRSIQAATGMFYLAVIMAFSAEMSAKLGFF